MFSILAKEPSDWLQRSDAASCFGQSFSVISHPLSCRLLISCMISESGLDGADIVEELERSIVE